MYLENFCLWYLESGKILLENPESWALESRIQLKESRIQVPSSGIQTL